MNQESSPSQTPVKLPAIMAISVGAAMTTLLTEDGEVKTIPNSQAATTIHQQPVLCCHGPYTKGRLGNAEFLAFDVLELFAFTHPATFAIPTPHGLCDILNLPKPAGADDIPFALMDIARTLLEHLRYDQLEAKAPAGTIAAVMGLQGKGWPWTPFIMETLGEAYDPAVPTSSKTALNIWKHLPEWEDEAPRPPPDHHPVSADETLTRLSDLLQNGDHKSEARPQQKDYAAHIANAFDTPNIDETPHVVLAEAGTGTGKTLGYLAPASLWAEKNQGAVWISTYTKNLQRQIARELDRLYPNQAEKEAKVAIRKGRENYLCLLNLEENAAAATTAYNPQQAISAGIMARWAAASKDGDLTGADFPGWLSGLLGYQGTLALADRRGECIYSACDHYKKCFTEHSTRKAKSASLVIANHALVMIQSALASPLETLPSRYIFDEGHHLFDAADSAFSAHLTAQETRDLRRWILGNEGGKRGRARGLKRRAEDLCAGDSTAEALLRAIITAAEGLTNDGWTRRLKNSAPSAETEEFFHAIYAQVNARNEGQNTPYSIETGVHPVDPEVLPKALALQKALQKLQKPMQDLVKLFLKKLQDHEDTLDGDTRKRLEAVAHAIDRRASLSLQAWIDMLKSLNRHPVGIGAADPHKRDPEKANLAEAHITGSPQSERSNERRGDGNTGDFTDWLEITRQNGQAIDIGFFRHWIDPMKPFAQAIEPHLNGMAITSATLLDGAHDDEGWKTAEHMTGARYLSPAPENFTTPSPFDYTKQTQVIIIDDVNKNDLRQVSGAYINLFKASGGGGLGLFTAISRLRSVHREILAPLAENDINLYGQHVDEIDTGTLIDMFRFDEHSCMLGTDAARDGVDIPGHSLRLLAFDRVPWPRPTLLHKARRAHFGGRAYDEKLTRLKLKQAYGRLIRREDDKGVFVMLDGAMPTRLQSAFPDGVTVTKCGLAEASTMIKDFLNNEA